jgi:uncharacterized protein
MRLVNLTANKIGSKPRLGLDPDTFCHIRNRVLSMQPRESGRGCLGYSVSRLSIFGNFPGRGPLARLVPALLFLLSSIPGAYAQAAVASSSYITPFPQGDRYEVRVIGDWFGSGLASGLQDALKDEPSMDVADASRSSYGLLRSDGLMADADKLLANPVHIVVVMLGMNDRQSIKNATGNAQPGTPEWKEAYGKEAEKLLKKLRNANAAVYWIGLPPMSSPSQNEFAASVNDSIRQAVYLSGAKFVETTVGFTDQSGAYSPWGTDVSGQTKRLRDGDGAGLTQAGYRKIASFVEISIRRDLAQARSQRTIPLAGDEEEQARVIAATPRNLVAKSSDNAKPGAAWKAETAAGAPTQPAKIAGADAKAEAVPAIAETAKASQTVFSEAGSQSGEYILAELGNGLTSIAVITPVGDLSMREIQRQTPLADRLYYKVLSKGEAVPPKEGRADDFHWRGEETKSQ